jgi:hypothetical protein
MSTPTPSASPLESLAALRDHFRNTPTLVLLQATNAPYISHEERAFSAIWAYVLENCKS